MFTFDYGFNTRPWIRGTHHGYNYYTKRCYYLLTTILRFVSFHISKELNVLSME